MGEERKSARLPIAFIVVCNVLILTFALLPIVESEVCKQTDHSADKNCSPYELVLLFGARVFDFLHQYEGAFTALSTVAVAVFTWRLWVSTDKLWEESRNALSVAQQSADAATQAAEAATRQARAAVNVERPFVYARGIGFQIKSGPNFSKIPESEWEKFAEFYEVVALFHNYGRTPAFVVNVRYGYSVSEGLPSKPTYPHVARAGANEIVILPDDRHRIVISDGSFVITPEERKAIDSRSATLWFWGAISYRDFFNGVATSGFVAEIVQQLPRRKGSIPQIIADTRFGGPPQYTRQTYVEPDET